MIWQGRETRASLICFAPLCLLLFPHIKTIYSLILPTVFLLLAYILRMICISASPVILGVQKRDVWPLCFPLQGRGGGRLPWAPSLASHWLPVWVGSSTPESVHGQNEKEPEYKGCNLRACLKMFQTQYEFICILCIKLVNPSEETRTQRSTCFCTSQKSGTAKY